MGADDTVALAEQRSMWDGMWRQDNWIPGYETMRMLQLGWANENFEGEDNPIMWVWLGLYGILPKYRFDVGIP